MNKHECTQNENIEKIQTRLKTQKQLGEETFDKVQQVEKSLEEHRCAQQEQDEIRESRSMEQKNNDIIVNNKLNNLAKQMESLIALNTEVSNIKIAWKIGTKLGLGLALFIGTAGVIFGGIYGIKEWIKK